MVDLRMNTHYYEYKQVEETVFTLPLQQRNLNVTSTIEIKSEEEMSLKYKIFYFAANMGGFYTIWIVLVGIILKPILGKVLEFHLVNSFMKSIQAFMHFSRMEFIKKEEKKMDKEKILKNIKSGAKNNINQWSIPRGGQPQGVDGDLVNLRNVDENAIPEAFEKSEISQSIFSCTKSSNDEYSKAVKSMNFGRSIIKIVGNVNLYELKFQNLQQMADENRLLDLEIEEELKLAKQTPGMTKKLRMIESKEWISNEDLSNQNKEQKQHVKSIHNIVNNEIRNLEQDIVRGRKL